VSLPELIEVIPLERPTKAEITVPGSKSITNRALILAALAEGETTLDGALWSEDTQVMVECLRELGFMVNITPDREEACNRIITVYGKGGAVPPGGTPEQPLELFVGNAGTTARFLTAFVCLGKGAYRLHGVPRMHERPQAGLFDALRQLGYRIDSPNNKLPAIIHGAGPKPGVCQVSILESSQFASALLLSSQAGGWKVGIVGENSEEAPYVLMTRKLMETFPKGGNRFRIEPDASSGSYFWAVQEGSVSVANWPGSGWQIDERFPIVLQGLRSLRPGSCGGAVIDNAPRKPHEMYAGGIISRATDLGDSIMTAIVLAPFTKAQVHFTDLARLRVQECDRVSALRTELTKCGAKVIESGNTLEVFPSELHGAEIETYNDHRMAMCFAILGLKVPGIKIKNPACVKKTFPDFFQKLAVGPTKGLGARIRDPIQDRALGLDELFAGDMPD
jgi:3-phosphoshikimate 1-carboxyvinyltransferase